MAASSGLYRAIHGDPDYEHVVNDGRPTRFHDWVRGRQVYAQWVGLGFKGGYKLHVSSHPDDAEAVASLLLPRLRAMNTYHKIVSSPRQYELINEGSQQGKFITVYCGPVMETFQNAIRSLDRALELSRTRPGPRPGLRHGTGAETPIGQTGHLTYYTIEDFSR